MCIHPDPELEAAKLRQCLTIAQYRPVERLCSRCGGLECDGACRSCWARRKPAEEGREAER